MAKLLHIQASPRGDESYSVRAAGALTEEWAARAGAVETLDLYAAEIPPFEAPAARAKYAVMGGEEPADEAQRAWKGVIEVIEHFKAADAYVLGFIGITDLRTIVIEPTIHGGPDIADQALEAAVKQARAAAAELTAALEAS